MELEYLRAAEAIDAQIDATDGDRVRNESLTRAQRRELEELVDAYRADLVAAGMFAATPGDLSGAHVFHPRRCERLGCKLSMAEQCATPLKDRRVVGWLIVTGRLRPSPDYLVAWQALPRRDRCPSSPAGFINGSVRTSTELGFDPSVSRLQWSALVKVAALVGLTPEQMTKAMIDAQAKSVDALR